MSNKVSFFATDHLYAGWILPIDNAFYILYNSN